MKELLKKIGERLEAATNWALDHHPGKFIGALLGILMALFIIILGFWQTICLIVLAAIGFSIGKFWDDGKGLPDWTMSLLKKIRNLKMRKYK
ncbi:Protein of unknown function DUF2273 [Syntrophobotulus glycolicus DSM 8271]|uniref:Small integral membrane protein n=1 Tax=Syntrophobotulus glycolicus (strain DSM 8271 / FlGlyR) TaxID=645991 RepID=F0T0R3_SYNGF|nr:DUF2273 domain-containing protein [Syntrophobotulus glycolicus]ADY56202.1 Protein of unknown function DUF2273 [Syntrophobotulus glycolicus DSM 8271]